MHMETMRALLMGTALVAPMAGAVHAQSITINEGQLTGKSAECRTLARDVAGIDVAQLPIEAQEIVAAINADDPDECASYSTEVVSAAGTQTQRGTDQATLEETDTDNERVTEQVTVSEDATIEGLARVTVPEPEVDVEVPAPSVRVIQQQPQVEVEQGPAQLEVEQAEPTISVEIPEIVVRVEIPAPTVYMLMSDPEVRVGVADPEIEVEQGEPRITVAQAEPELAVDLDVDAGADGAEAQTADAGQASTQGAVEGEAQGVGADVELAQSQPQIEILEADGQPQLTYRSGEPSIEYAGAEPRISVSVAQQPTIEVSQAGETRVIVESAAEREQRRQGRTQDDAANRAAPEGQQQVAAGGTQMTVGELMDMDVVTADGEDLGEPDAIIDVNGQMHLVLEDGGFLGIGGKQVPVPLSRVLIRGDELVLQNMTEDEIEAANDYSYDRSAVLPMDQPVQITGG